jgi:glutamine phosphoribosylpyrophosphate amidotransferase
MCAIIGWSGVLPKGIITNLLREAESRGRDSTGIAFRTLGENLGYRQAISADQFIKVNNNMLGQARKSLRGLAHCRRASRGMPINDDNAHPFIFGKYFFAHNGKISNWEVLLKQRIEQHTKELADLKAASEPNQRRIRWNEYLLQYLGKITTDSMVLGPYIAERNFQEVEGCFGLVWMATENVYVCHSCKELEAVEIIWHYKDGDDKSDQALTIAASTKEIVAEAFAAVKTIEYNYKFVTLEENRIYRLEPTGCVDEGVVPVNPKNYEDAFTSEPEPEAVTTTEIEEPEETDGISRDNASDELPLG